MRDSIALFVGPSGSGKTTVANYLCETANMTQIDSYTTRSPRYPGETGHVFISEEEFDKLTDMVAFTLFNGHRYCATAQQVDENDIYVVDVCGVEFFKKSYHGRKNVKVFYFAVDEGEVMRRMMARGDNAEAIAGRIRNDKVMFANALERLKALYDDVFEIENINIKDAANTIKQLLGGVQKGVDDAGN